MDPEYEVIVLFISTTKWSIKVISIDRRTPPNTNTTVYIMQITSLPFILAIRSLQLTFRTHYLTRESAQEITYIQSATTHGSS